MEPSACEPSQPEDPFPPSTSETATSPAERRGGRFHYFPHVSDQDWNDWRWQFRNRVTTLEELTRFFPIPAAERAMHAQVLADFRMGVTPYYLSLIDPHDPHDPLRKQVVPFSEEYEFRAFGDEDPLGEEDYSPVPGITHRYPDRVLMVISNSCAIYCRYCTRKRIMYEDATPDIEIDRMVAYIAATPQVRDVVVSGGDPLTYATPKLERILAKLRAIPHLEIIRIGSRVPVALPQRIDAELCAMLQKYHPLWINVHYNHPRECTPEAARACDQLSRAGIPLNNQSVLLRGVNDTVAVQKQLVHALMRMRVRPYYLYQCDPVRGAEHFRTTVREGLEIVEGLRGHTSGLAIPTYVIDAPGGGGKIPIHPQYLLSYDQKEGRAILRNFQGRVFEYLEPSRDAAPGSRIGGEAVLPSRRNAAAAGHGSANGNGNGNGHAHGNGNGHGHNGNGANGNGANGNGHGEIVVGKSKWAHRNPPRGGCGPV